MKKEKSLSDFCSQKKGFKLGDFIRSTCYDFEKFDVYRVVGIEIRKGKDSLIKTVMVYPIFDKASGFIYSEHHCHKITAEWVREIEKEHREIESKIRSFIK